MRHAAGAQELRRTCSSSCRGTRTFLRELLTRARASSTRGWPPSSSSSSRRGWRTGTSAATGRTSASPSRARRTSTSTSGWTRPSATSPPPRSGRRRRARRRARWTTGAQERDARIVHFIGKDIVYFHALFWPAVLKVAGFKRPTQLKVHGHLTVNGEKMSKSRGTLVTARTYLDNAGSQLPALLLRGEPGRRGPRTSTSSLKDFRLRVNGELVNNMGNLANRGAVACWPGRWRSGSRRRREGPGKALVEAALARVPRGARGLREAGVPRGDASIIVGDLPVGQPVPPGARAVGEGEDGPRGARADLSDAADVLACWPRCSRPSFRAVTEKLFAQLGAPPLTFAELHQRAVPAARPQPPVGTPEPLLPRLEEAQVNLLVPPEELARLAAESGKSASPGSRRGGRGEGRRCGGDRDRRLRQGGAARSARCSRPSACPRRTSS